MLAKKGLFKVCQKTGKIVGINRQWRWFKWLFPVIGLAALIWYLVRVIPKPSRADYPCQKVAAPFALGGIVYLFSIFGLITTFRKARKFLYQHRYAAAGICLLSGLVCAMLVQSLNESSARAENTGTFTPSDGANQPIGTARGIFPGRVAWSYDLSACNWDGSSKYWWSSTYNDQTKITALMNNVICSVAGQTTVSGAWNTLFKNKNGGAAYVKGEKIAIKINLNNGGASNEIDASPQSVYALLDGLVNGFGVNQADITICDPARENKCSAVQNYCKTAFPNVIYDTNLGGFTANAFAYSVAGPTETSLSTAIVNAKYLITMALLKRHAAPSATYGTDGIDDGNASVTMIFKSDWGIIGNNRASQHSLLRVWEQPLASYDLLVDIYGSKNINGKTVITILDGLYSGNLWNSGPYKWRMAPFNNHWPSSFFASQDPVALESVGLDFLRTEMGLVANADRHLHEAALASNPASGTVYKPDGVRLSSLGVHEHWNNAADKKYSRNLGTGAGIELVTVLPNNTPVANGIYKIINLNSGLALDVNGGFATNSTAVDQYTYKGHANQQWAVTNLGSNYEIIGVQSGKALDVSGASTANGAIVDIYTYQAHANQQWIITPTSGGYYTVQGVGSGKLLDVVNAATTNSAAADQWQSNGGKDQQWSLQAP